MAGGPWDEFAADDSGPWGDYGSSGAQKPQPKKGAGVIRRIADMTAVPIAQGIVGVPEAAVGLADLVTGGRAGKAAEQLGFRPREAKQIIGDALYSDEQKEADRKVAQAEGFADTALAALENPSTIVRTVAESAPSMLAGGAISRLALRAVPALSPVAAGAIGEGAVSAGQNAEQVRQESADGLLTPGQSAALAASGAVTGAISRLSGGAARALGITDPETALAAGALRPLARAGGEAAEKATEKGIARKAAEGFLTEGLLEEMPQSMQEQVFQNIAQGKPWNEGVGAAGATGLLAGGLTGAAIGPLSREGKQQQEQPKPLLLGYDENADQMIGFQDGTIARRSEVENYLASLSPGERADAMAKLHGYGPQPASAADFTTSPGAAPPTVAEAPGPEPQAPDWTTTPGAADPRDGIPFERVVDTNIEIGPLQRAARMLALPAPGQYPPGQTLQGRPPGEVGSGAQFDLQRRASGETGPDTRPAGDWRDAARPIGPISRAAGIAQRMAPGVPASASASAAPGSNGTTAPRVEAESVPRGSGAFMPQPGDIVVDDHFHAAHAAATSPLNDRAEPTEGQKGAGNYAKGHVKVAGLDISIENPQGSKRSGTDRNGKRWERELTAHYGYIRRSEGADGDHVDVFIKPGTPRDFNGMVYVIDQVDPKTGKFDEHKVILGAANGPDAVRIYRSNYDADWQGLADMTAMRMDAFKNWVRSKDATKRPLGNIIGARERARQAAAASPAAAPASTATGPVAGSDGGMGAAQAAANPAPAQPEAKGVDVDARARAALKARNAQAAASWDKNPMLAFVAEQGLYHVKGDPQSLMREFSPDAQISVPGVHIATFRSTGKKLDMLLPEAIEEGFLPPGADEGQLYDLIARAIRGERVIPAYAEGEAQREAERRIRAREKDQQAQHEEMTNSAAPAADSSQSDAAPSEEAPAGSGESAGEPAATSPQPTAAPAPTATAAPAPKPDAGLRLGITPGDAEPVTVQDGVVHVGKYEALDFDTGEPVRVPATASTEDIKKALRDAGAVGRKAKFFGGGEAVASTTAPQQNAPGTPEKQSPAADSGSEAGPDSAAAGPSQGAGSQQASAASTEAASAAPSTTSQTQDTPPSGGTTEGTPAAAAPRKPKAPAARETTAAPDKIEDFGEKILGARKDYAALLKDAMEIDVGAAPLSKSWPEPDYQKLLDAGTDPWTVAFVHAARDSVPTKPQKAWKLKPWVEQVTQLRKFADELLSGRWKRDAIEPFITRGTLRELGDTVELYQRLGHEIPLKGITVSSGSYSVYDGKPYSPAKVVWTVEQKQKATAFSNMPRRLADGDTREQAIQAFIDKVKQDPNAGQKAKKTATFDLWRENGKVHLGKKVGGHYVTLKVFDGRDSKTVAEARAYRDAHIDELTQALERYKSTPMERAAENQPRIGDDHRGGARVTPQVFADTFGFRGVQFGNYVENERRQQDLNDAYDALMDMAAVLNVPPRALSLNGGLGLAFGARGRGGKNAPGAHYESGHAVFNLTKGGGAGALGHEWFHALDNYFGKADGGPGGYQTSARNPKVRPEMQKAFDGVMAAIRSTGMLKRSLALDERKSKPYWSTNLELAARAYEAYLVAKLQDQNARNDYLANIVSENFWNAQDALLGHENEKTYPYPTEAEMGPIREAFDNFFHVVQVRETDAGLALFKIDLDTPMPSGITMRQAREQLAGLRDMPIAKAQAVVEGITKDWKGGIEVRVVATPQDLPTRNPNPHTKGYYFNGVGYVVASKHKTAQDIGRTIAHEVIQHHGMRSVLGEENWRRLMAQIQAAANAGNPELQEARDYVRKAYRTADGKYMLKEGGSLEADEVAARLIERSVDENGNMRPKLQWLKWVWSKIASFLRSVGFKSMPLTMSELHGIWVESRRAIETGRGTQPDLQVAMAARAAQEARDDAPLRLPDAVIGAGLAAATGHPDYHAAKAGDVDAALRVAQSIVTPDLVARVRAAIGASRPTVLPVVSEETGGRNAIPRAAAEVLAHRLGLPTATGIVQANRAHRSGLDGLDRIFAAVDFAGDVAPGDYLLLDDTLTQGGTLAALANHVQAAGGRVAGIVALTGKQYSGKITASTDTLTALRQKHGDLEDQFRAATGYGFDALTQSEARYLASYQPAERVRARIAEEARRAAERDDQGEAGEGLAAIDIAGDTGRYTPEQLQAMRNVGFAAERVPLQERARALWKDAGKRLAQGLVDQFAPIKDISKEAYGLLRLSKGASGAFEVLLQGGQLKLTDGVYDFDEKKSGGVVERLLIPLQGEHHDFFRWVAANRAEQLAKEDREHLFTGEDIAALKTLADGELPFDYTLQHGARAGQTTRSRPEAYADALATFNEFNRNTLDMAEQSGLIDGEARKLWEREFYVPFYRVEDEGGVRGMNVKSGVVRQQAFKQLKGGSQKLNADLLENTLMNWAHLIDAAAKNRAAKATLEAMQNLGAAIEAREEDVRQMGRSMGKRNNVVWFMDAGRQRHFLIDDPHLLAAVSALEFSGFNSPVMKALSTTKHWLTRGVTASPFFKVRNLIRDTVQAIASAPLSYNPVENLREGARVVGKGSLNGRNTDEWYRMLAGGATIHFGTMLEGSEAKRVQSLVKAGVDRGTILDSAEKVKAFYRRVVEPLVSAYEELGNRGETINRAALYQQLRKQGVSHAEAALQARDLMDFSMQGSFTTVRFLTQVVPFMNARMQGVYKLGRAAQEDPARFAVVLAATAVLSIGLLAAYSDDDDWKKREDWDRNNYWWFKAGGIAYRIPKPFEIGAMATLAERTWELAIEPEMTNTRFRQQVIALLGDQLALNPVPQLVRPILDVYSNVDAFTGRPIESMGMEKLQPQFRFRESTSMFARGASTALSAAGRTIGVEGPSPVQIDHLVRGYFGWLGTLATAGGDILARPATGQVAQPTPDYWKVLTGSIASQLEDAPSRYVSQVYDQAKELEQVYGTWRYLQREGKVEEARAFRDEYEQELVRYRQAEGVKRAITTINQLKKRVEESDAAPDEKRSRLRELNERADAVARRLAPV